MKSNPETYVNPQANLIIEIIQQVLVNFVHTYNLREKYLDKEDPWKVILVAEVFLVHSTYHIIKYNSTGQLVFIRDIIISIKYVSD